MKIVLDDKKKGLLNIYWFSLIVLAVVGLVNLLAISLDSIKAAAIVNLVFLILIPIIFVLGYVDYRRYAPLSIKKEIAYCVTAVIALWIILIDFNVRNYSVLTDYTGESYYIIGVSIVCALYLAIAFICLLLTLLNIHNRRRQAKFYYATAISSLISSIVLTAFNYSTYLELFWAPLRLIGIKTPILIDSGLTILELRVLIEYCIFIFHAVNEKKKKLLDKGEESEYRPLIVKLSITAIVFMMVNIIVLPAISSGATINVSRIDDYLLAYEIIELISVAVLLSVGAAIALQCKKSEKFGPIYLRMGIAAIVFAIVYLIMDFIPITSMVKTTSAVQAQMVSDVFHASVKMAGLFGYTIYVAFGKKLNATIRALDKEHEEKFSSENYSI